MNSTFLSSFAPSLAESPVLLSGQPAETVISILALLFAASVACRGTHTGQYWANTGQTLGEDGFLWGNKSGRDVVLGKASGNIIWLGYYTELGISRHVNINLRLSSSFFPLSSSLMKEDNPLTNKPFQFLHLLFPNPSHPPKTPQNPQPGHVTEPRPLRRLALVSVMDFTELSR